MWLSDLIYGTVATVVVLIAVADVGLFKALNLVEISLASPDVGRGADRRNMRDAFHIFWKAIKNLWEEIFLLSIMNIVTMLPAILVVTFPPALAGLWSAANRAVDGLAIHWSDYLGVSGVTSGRRGRWRCSISW